MIRKLKKNFNEIVDSIRYFKIAPFEKSSYLINALMVTMALISSVVLLVFFIKSGGYERQMNVISGYESGSLFSMVMFGSYKKIMPYLIGGIAIEVLINIVGKMKLNDTCSYKTIVYGALVVLLIIPVILLLAENILPVAIVLVVITFGISFLWRGKGGQSYESSSRTRKTTYAVKAKMQTEKSSKKSWDVIGDIQFWVESNMTGDKVIKAYKKGAFSSEYNTAVYYGLIDSVTLKEFLKGEKIITLNGRRINEKDLYYRK